MPSDQPIAVVFNRDVLKHNPGSAHPEQARRASGIVAHLDQLGDSIPFTWIESRDATVEEVQAAHSATVIKRLNDAVEAGGGILDAGDTVAYPGSDRAAFAAAGASIEAVRLAGEGQPAFAIVRPPGHHATPNQSMGFCIFNNVAIAAEYAIRSGIARRVAIIDFDVHHGNGTQDVFYERDDVLFISSHQYPAYPGTGAASETGSGPGKGFTANLPYGRDIGDDGFLEIYEMVLPSLLSRFAPDLVIVSAGYDAHWLNNQFVAGIQQNVTVSGFYRLATLLMQFAHEYSDGKICAVLEGGYHVGSLAEGVEATLRAWSGLPAAIDSFGGSGRREASVEATIREVIRIHGIRQAT